MAEPGILFWDRINNYNILSEDNEFEYAGTNPCAEGPLPAGGSCLLGAMNLASYVVNKRFDYESFKRDIHVVVRAMDDVLEQGLPLHPLQIQKDTVRDYRQIGIGIMGLADMLIKMEYKYDTVEAIYLCDEIGFAMANEVIKANALLSKERGTYPKYNKEAVLNSSFIQSNTDKETYSLVEEYGLRNSQVLTIAPTGSISTMIQVSGGIEPIFSFSYNRKTESLHGEERYYKVYTKIVKDYMEENGLTEEEELPNFFVNAQTINPFKRVDIQGVWQEHIDASISSTVNLPNETTIEDVERLYTYAWERGLKGMTIFRDGCARTGVLTLEDKKEENSEEVKELKRGEVVSTNDNVIGLKRKIAGGCGSLHVQAFFDEETGEMTEVFINKGGSGGCNSNLNALSRMISIALRGGVKIEDIADQLASTINCPSFASARAKGLPLSQGSSCPSAVGRVLVEMNKDFQEMFKPKKANEKMVEEKENISNEERDFIEKYGETEFAKRYHKCPICRSKVMNTGGCISCPNGCWSKCD
jgi:ribonucleoside-diphosphate reductase alpha chain